MKIQQILRRTLTCLLAVVLTTATFLTAPATASSVMDQPIKARKPEMNLTIPNSYTLKDNAQNPTLVIDGQKANLYMGGGNHVGDLLLLDDNGEPSVYLAGGSGNLELGGKTHNADVRLFDAKDKLNVYLDGAKGNVYAGGGGHDGDLVLTFDNGEPRIEMEGYDSSARFINSDGKVTIAIDGQNGDIKVGDVSLKAALEKLAKL